VFDYQYCTFEHIKLAYSVSVHAYSVVCCYSVICVVTRA